MCVCVCVETPTYDHAWVHSFFLCTLLSDDEEEELDEVEE